MNPVLTQKEIPPLKINLIFDKLELPQYSDLFSYQIWIRVKSGDTTVQNVSEITPEAIRYGGLTALDLLFDSIKKRFLHYIQETEKEHPDLQKLLTKLSEL